VGGICVTTVGQAEVFAEAGFTDIFIANEIVTRPKITGLCALAHSVTTTVAVDSPRNVTDLSDAASEAGVTIRVVVDVNTRLNRCGVEPGQPAVELASLMAKAPNLDFAGLMTYEGAMFEEDPEKLAAESRKWVQQVLDTREMIEKAGMDVSVVSAGGTWNYDIVGDMPGVTEVPAGSYALSDGRYLQHRPEFKTAARVMSEVTSHPEPSMVLTDGGMKSVGVDAGLPLIDNILGIDTALLAHIKTANAGAEHGKLIMEGDAEDQVDLGDKVWVIPSDVGMCANLHDYAHAIRNGKLEAVWSITARGRYR
jgi:3-hydroxy-D-aspartate aldolase